MSRNSVDYIVETFSPRELDCWHPKGYKNPPLRAKVVGQLVSWGRCLRLIGGGYTTPSDLGFSSMCEKRLTIGVNRCCSIYRSRDGYEHPLFVKYSREVTETYRWLATTRWPGHETGNSHCKVIPASEPRWRGPTHFEVRTCFWTMEVDSLAS